MTATCSNLTHSYGWKLITSRPFKEFLAAKCFSDIDF